MASRRGFAWFYDAANVLYVTWIREERSVNAIHADAVAWSVRSVASQKQKKARFANR